MAGTVSLGMTSEGMRVSRRLRVLLATPVPIGNGVLDYLAEGEAPPRGQVVLVPLGSRQVPGVVLGPADERHARDRHEDASPERDLPKLRAILRWADLPLLSSAFLDWLDRVASWTMAHPGAVLRMALPLPKGLENQPPPNGWVAASPPRDGLSPARNRVLEAAFGIPAMTATDLAHLAGVSPSTIIDSVAGVASERCCYAVIVFLLLRCIAVAVGITESAALEGLHEES